LDFCRKWSAGVPPAEKPTKPAGCRRSNDLFPHRDFPMRRRSGILARHGRFIKRRRVFDGLVSGRYARPTRSDFRVPSNSLTKGEASTISVSVEEPWCAGLRPACQPEARAPPHLSSPRVATSAMAVN
jgi:hypothetical protein